MIKQEQNTNEIEHNMHVSIICALRSSIRDNWKYRSSGIIRVHMKRDIATLRLVRTSKLFTKKF